MQWIELSLDTTSEAVDWICTLLATTSYTSDIRITKYTNSDLDEITEEEGTELTWAFTIYIYLPYDANTRTRISEIENLLSPLQRTGLTTDLHMDVVEEKAVSEELSPLVRRIGKRFVVVPDDTPYNSSTPDEIALRLKTTLAFGSGLHPATMLALQLIERHVVPNINVLDLGSGSGILSVAIAKLGAEVLALDNDPVAVESTQDAVNRNFVEKRVKVMQGSLGRGSDLGHWMGGDISNVPSIQPTADFDMIVANILARVHTTLAPEYKQALRRNNRGGILITAGFTTDYEEAIVTSFSEEGFEVIDCERFNEWVAFAHRLS